MAETPEGIDLILAAVQGCRDEIAAVDRDLGEDRKNNEKLTLRVGAVENKLEAILDMMHTLQNKVKKGVDDAVKPMIESANNLSETTEELTGVLETKRSVPFLGKPSKKKWWQVWRKEEK